MSLRCYFNLSVNNFFKNMFLGIHILLLYIIFRFDKKYKEITKLIYKNIFIMSSNIINFENIAY